MLVPRGLALWSQVVTCEDGQLAVSPIRLAPAVRPEEEPQELPQAEVLPTTLIPALVAGRYVAMKVAFTAPTDGYGLKLLDVRVQDGVADVWLWRKLPQDGQGRSRIAVEHTVKAGFEPVRAVRVFLADAAAAPSADARSRLLARFPQ